MEKVAPSGKSVVFKESITRNEDRKLTQCLLAGAKSTQSGDLDQASVAMNVEKQKDLLVETFIVTFDGKKISTAGNLDKLDFDFCYEQANEIYKGLGKKKD